MTIEVLAGAIDELVEADPSVLADSESVLALYRQLSRLEAVASRATARWDADRVWEADKARSGPAWLARRTRLPKPTVARRVRLGRAVRKLPAAEEAWLAGDIDGAHVSTLVSHSSMAATSEAMVRDQELLVGQATRLRFDHFCKAMAYWEYRADPDKGEADFAKLHDERRADRGKTWKGHWHFNGWLDPIGGTVVDSVLQGVEDELFEADWAEAKQRLGREPAYSDLLRTAAQRRADALLEMALRAATAPADGRRPEPCFTVLIGEGRLDQLCELANGTVIPPGALVPWLDRAWLERVIFGSPSRVIDVGVRTRLFKGALRRAIQVRDRECFEDICDEPADRCQVDHIQPYEHGGETTQDNGRAACGFHNRLRNRRNQHDDGDDGDADP